MQRQNSLQQNCHLLIRNSPIVYGCRIETYRSPEKFTNKNTQSARARIYFRIKQRRRPLIANIAAFPQKYRQHLSVSTCLPCSPVTGTLQANNQTSLHYVLKIHFEIYNACQEIRPVCDCRCMYVCCGLLHSRSGFTYFSCRYQQQKIK